MVVQALEEGQRSVTPGADGGARLGKTTHNPVEGCWSVSAQRWRGSRLTREKGECWSRGGKWGAKKAASSEVRRCPGAGPLRQKDLPGSE